MHLLKTHYHPDIKSIDGLTVLKRLATRAICLKDQDILLLFTERYHDYSLPGGGIDEGEDIIDGMKRELIEETGAQNIQNIKPYGIYEEFRPWYKPEHDIMHMLSHCYTCDVDKNLKDTSYESYEINNGMRPEWINIFEAIDKNKHTLNNSDKKGLSLVREIFLLEHIAKNLISL